MMMTILAIDLGLTGAGGLAVVEDGNPPRVWDTVALPERQSGLEFSLHLIVLLELYTPYLIICEKPWTGRRDPRPAVGMAQRERLGLVKLACEQHGLPKSRLKLIPAATMKRMVTGNGRASKEQVGSIVRSILGTKETNEHVLDALGLCLAGIQQERVRKAGLKQRVWERKERARV